MWNSKLIFTFSFLLQVLANYFVIQNRWVDKKDIIIEVRLITITSCQMKCTNTKNCATICFNNDTDLLVNDRFFLLKEQKEKGKEEGAGTKLLYVLVDVSIYLSFFLFGPHL